MKTTDLLGFITERRSVASPDSPSGFVDALSQAWSAGFVLAHVSIQCTDPTASRTFYEAVLEPVGAKALLTYGDHVGFVLRRTGPTSGSVR